MPNLWGVNKLPPVRFLVGETDGTIADNSQPSAEAYFQQDRSEILDVELLLGMTLPLVTLLHLRKAR